MAAEAHLVEGDALQLNAAVGRCWPNCLNRQQAVGAFPGLLAVGREPGIILAHSVILRC